MRQVFLDTETTGLSVESGDRIIEIGCVEMFNRKPTGKRKHFYLNPGRDSHEDALRVHGITSDFLRDKPAFDAVVDELLEFLSGAEIVIHNAAFDIGFLNQELRLLGRPPIDGVLGSIVDSLSMAKELYPGKRNSLDSLCDRLGVDNSGRTLHGALLDAELLADVYIHMTRGQEALLMDAEVATGEDDESAALDLRAFDLPILVANPQELQAHADILVQLDKSSSGKTLWRLAVQAHMA